MNKPKEIIIHHSLTKDGKVVDFDAIKRYHMQTNGWKDIGYHYVVELVGDKVVVKKGRADNVEGAHTVGKNSNSIGICFVGNYDVTVPSNDMLVVGRNLIVDLFKKYGKMPITTHNKYAPKSCPGKLFPIDKLRGMVYEIVK